MKANTIPTGNNMIVTIFLGVLALVLIASVFTGRKLPLIGSDKAALIALLIVGVAMCAPGIGRVAASGAWAQPLSILAYLIGALILLIGFAGLFGFRLPLITDARAAILGVAVLGAAKIVLSLIHRIWL